MKLLVLSAIVVAVFVTFTLADDKDGGSWRSRGRRRHGDRDIDIDRDVDIDSEYWRRRLSQQDRRRGWLDDDDDFDIDDDDFDLDIDDDEDDDDDVRYFRGGSRRNSGRKHRNRGRRPSRRRSDEDRDLHHGDRRKHHRDRRRITGEAADTGEAKQAAGMTLMSNSDLRRFLPDMDWATPWMKGHFQVGPSIGMSWDLGDVFGGRREKWWEGENVCSSNNETETDLEEQDIASHYAIVQTYCDETETSHKCTTEVTMQNKKKSYVTTFECCDGFAREEGKSGCTKELQLVDLMSTAQQLNLSQLYQAVVSVGLQELLLMGNFTIFGPSDEAFERAFPQMDDFNNGKYSVVEVAAVNSLNVVNLATELEDILSGHLVDGIVKISNLENNMMLSTFNPNIKLRINKYEVPKRLVLANCQPLTSADNPAKNGIIHTVDSVLQPVEETLLDLVSSNQELSTLKTVLAKTGLSRDLDSATGDYTLFAPTNSAFSKLDSYKLEKLLDSSNCLTNVLKEHLLPHLICSGVFANRVRTFNTLRNHLHLSRTEEDKLFVGRAQVVVRDVMATNGVMHIIDDVLIPDEALDVFDVAEKEGATEFLKLVKAAGLTKALQQMDDFTVFVPSNEAIRKLPNATLQALGTNTDTLSKVLKYHILPTDVSGKQLRSGQELDTLDSNKKVRLRDYSSFPFSLQRVKTAQCAPIVKYDVQSCNARIHVVDQVLMPPEGDVLDVLGKDSRFSTLMGLLKNSGLADELQLSGPFTVFAPTNEAFGSVDSEVLETLKNDSHKLKKLLKHHILRDSLCCAGVFHCRWLLTPRQLMLDGSAVALSRRRGEIQINNVDVVSCDQTATNGVVHAINSILPEAVKKYAGRHRRRPHGREHLKNSFRKLGDQFGQKLDAMQWEFEWPKWMRRQG